MTEYFVPFSTATSLLVEKKSKFIGVILPVTCEEQAKDHLIRIRKENPDAVHHCYAYIIREQNIERFSDDGEPQGTAGKPILEVLRGNGVRDVLCVVTRYFGGTLLGTGGLVRAYSHTAKNTLLEAGIAKMRPFYNIQIICDYKSYDIILKEFENYTIYLDETEYTDKIIIHARVLTENYESLSKSLSEISCGNVQPQIINEQFLPLKIDLV